VGPLQFDYPGRERHLELNAFPTWFAEWVPPAAWAPTSSPFPTVPVPGRRQVVFTDGRPGERTFLVADLDRELVEPLFDVERLRSALADELACEPTGSGAPIESFAFADSAERVRFQVDGTTYDLDLTDYRLTVTSLAVVEAAARATPRTVEDAFQMGEPPALEVGSPDGRWLLGHGGGALLMRSTVDGRSQVLLGAPHDGADWTAREALWSPDGQRVVAACVDSVGVPRLPVVWWLKPEEEVTEHPYARPGARRPRTTWHVVDVRSGHVTDLPLGDYAEGACQPLRWRGDEVLFLVRERGSWTQRLVAVHAHDGAARVLHEEHDQNVAVHAYERAAAIADAATRVLPSDEGFLWLSDRSGWNHLEVRPFDGGPSRQLTAGDFPVERVMAVADDAVFVAARCNPARPYDVHVCRVALDGSGMRQLTSADGHHAAEFVGSASHFVDVHSTVARPPVAELRSATDGRLTARLRTADTSRLDADGWCEPEEFQVHAADGETELWGVLYRPSDLDETSPRPLVEVIYGGPQVIAHPVEFTQSMFGWLAQSLTALGFVTCVLDGRGTPGRSRAFHQQGHGTFGQHEIADHAAALRNLAATRPWIGLDRVGIVGASYGGYMATRAMLTAPELYKVGVAINAGAGDVFHGSGHEWFLGHPRDNPDGYRRSSNVDLANRLRGRLLLVHGTSDVNVPVSSTFKMLDAFTRAGVRYDLALLPDQGHAFTGASLRYRVDVTAQYLVDHLRP